MEERFKRHFQKSIYALEPVLPATHFSSILPKVILEMGYKDVQFPLRVSFSYKTKKLMFYTFLKNWRVTKWYNKILETK